MNNNVIVRALNITIGGNSSIQFFKIGEPDHKINYFLLLFSSFLAKLECQNKEKGKSDGKIYPFYE
ncbi:MULTISPECIES: hypothetical protein [Avibacterium]|uniref:Uncharacterized protein n=1 Tax=Avibacterium paragallinarum TaxID=728 RepID=A0AAE5TJJ9_AVIPA|nr:hypothetical protein [Avibacterium paragallinarum]MEE3679831.1 hypothetical protein [Avibacterium paragallinarum]PXZ40307.1 hypothetical protein DM482_01590 [Avibacterium paragallinarum]PXZ42298.1 hypothetical protein DM481_01260 [Avibacterium paragallinarum]QZP16118.1 hypothetical protein K5O18_01760 [Avibacterium paragallinarum]WAL57070.1 hypothetical protein OY678_01495 [Avibacterium paragallinarum]